MTLPLPRDLLQRLVKAALAILHRMCLEHGVMMGRESSALSNKAHVEVPPRIATVEVREAPNSFSVFAN